MLSKANNAKKPLQRVPVAVFTLFGLFLRSLVTCIATSRAPHITPETARCKTESIPFLSCAIEALDRPIGLRAASHRSNPHLGAQRQVDGHGVGAIHQPDAGEQLEEADSSATTAP